MNDRLQAMVRALGPTMNPHAAEITLRATALCRGKQVEALNAQDLPAIEAAVRHALEPVSSGASIDLTIYKIRELFLEARDGSDC